jgi:hypothetical protein
MQYDVRWIQNRRINLVTSSRGRSSHSSRRRYRACRSLLELWSLPISWDAANVGSHRLVMTIPTGGFVNAKCRVENHANNQSCSSAALGCSGRCSYSTLEQDSQYSCMNGSQAVCEPECNWDCRFSCHKPGMGAQQPTDSLHMLRFDVDVNSRMRAKGVATS